MASSILTDTNPLSKLHATCKCSAPIMVRDGAVGCAACGAPIALAGAKPDVYCSHSALPDGWKRRRFLERVRNIPEAQRTGGMRGRGVVWSISRAAWEASFLPTAPAAAPSNVVSIDALIGGAGYRPTKSA